MFAIARINSFDQDKLNGAKAELDEFARRHAGQPGYAGSLTVALDDGRHLTVNLWHSEQQAAAALSTLASEVRRVLEPLMTSPSKLLGTGPVETDLLLNAPGPAPGASS
jgi:hypothetical protein